MMIISFILVNKRSVDGTHISLEASSLFLLPNLAKFYWQICKFFGFSLQLHEKENLES
jgi:hypothetical protein